MMMMGGCSSRRCKSRSRRWWQGQSGSHGFCDQSTFFSYGAQGLLLFWFFFLSHCGDQVGSGEESRDGLGLWARGIDCLFFFLFFVFLIERGRPDQRGRESCQLQLNLWIAPHSFNPTTSLNLGDTT